MSYYENLGKVSVTVDGSTFDAVAASFRGAHFFVKNNDQGGGGRKVQVNKLAASDAWVCTDLGSNVPTLTMEFYLVGEDCDNAKEELLKACGTEGAAELIHPWLGTFQARCTGLNFRYGLDALGFIRGQITFQQEGSISSKIVVIDNRGATKVKAKSFKDSVKSSMATFYNVANKGKKTLEKIVDGSNDVLDAVFEARKVLQVADDFLTEVGRIKANMEVLAMTPGDFSQRIVDLVSATGEMFGIDVEKKDDVNEYIDLMALDVDLSDDYTGNIRLVRDTVRNVAGAMVVQSLVDCEFDSVDEAVGYQNRISDAFDKMFEEVEDVESYMKLSDLQATAMQYLRDVIASTAVILEKEVNSCTNVLQLCYDVYGNIDRVEEILSRNLLQQGLFIKPCKIKVRSK